MAKAKMVTQFEQVFVLQKECPKRLKTQKVHFDIYALKIFFQQCIGSNAKYTEKKRLILATQKVFIYFCQIYMSD